MLSYAASRIPYVCSFLCLFRYCVVFEIENLSILLRSFSFPILVSAILRFQWVLRFPFDPAICMQSPEEYVGGAPVVAQSIFDISPPSFD